jgi:tetratricopeptide (TPR) repeat protein
VAIATAGLGPGHPDLALHLYNRGEILRALARRAEARSSYNAARVIWERELGQENTMLAYVLTGIGQTFLDEGDVNSALIPLQRAHTIGQSEDPDSPRRAETSFALARALLGARRDQGRARALAEEAKALYAKTRTTDKFAEVED